MRAPHRLTVWLKKDDLVFRSSDDIRSRWGKKLVRALDRPDYFGYTVQLPGPIRTTSLRGVALGHRYAGLHRLRDAAPV